MRTALFLGLSALLASAAFAEAKDPVDWVNPEIGWISHLLTPVYPTMGRPNGQLRVFPPNDQYTQDQVANFKLLVATHRHYWGRFTFRPGPSPMTFDQQVIKPYRYDGYVDSAAARVALAPAEKSAVVEVAFEEAGPHTVAVGTSEDGELGWDGRALTGFEVHWGTTIYFHGEFDRNPSALVSNGKERVFSFGSQPGTVRFRYAVSLVSAAQAKANLRREIPDWGLDKVAAAGRAAWNEKLGKIRVEGGTDDQKIVFYTALYRCYERMIDITEDGRYCGWDKKIHAADGVRQYTDDWSWDTFRSAHPLMTILEPEAQAAKLTSYLRFAAQTKEGWVPTFPALGQDAHCMNGFHTVSLFLDAWRKGIRAFDLAAAYAACSKTLKEASYIPWKRCAKTELDRFMDERGYFPALKEGEKETCEQIVPWEKRQPVPVTLGHAYDAWCMAELARELKRPAAEIAEWERLAKNYRLLWKADTGFFHPKDADGKWIEPFDYKLSGGAAARDYYDENNGWTYNWDVLHDIPGLMDLFGGRKPFVAKLERLFNESLGTDRPKFSAQLADSTGMMGQFSMGNEPSFHIPYLFNFAGEPWKTQKTIRKVLEAWFRNDLMGIPGDEDGGAMSSFAVLSMLGFFPVTPGVPEYAWGSPVFTRAAIALENGKTFVLEAPGSSRAAKYIQSVTIDGKPSNRAWVSHADIARGAHVRVEMGNRPNKAWGTAER